MHRPSIWLLTVTVLLLLAGTARLSAAPASDNRIQLRQPDNAAFIARLRGDERGSRIETEDGYTIARDGNSWWRYVYNFGFSGGEPVLSDFPAHEPPPPALPRHVRRTVDTAADVRNTSITPQLVTPVGDFEGRLLILLVEFSNRSGSTSEGHWVGFFQDQVRDYLSAASYGAVNLRPARESFGGNNNGVVGWLNLGYPHPEPDVTGSSNQQLTRDALLAADAYVNFADHDSDNNGIVTPQELAVVVVAAGYESAYAGSPSPKLWAHYGFLPGADTPVLDGVQVGGTGYAQFGELHGDHPATVGIMLHELGHLIFGLPELYDTTEMSAGIGAFGIMGRGMWGMSSFGTHLGETPVLPTAWSRLRLGWVDSSQGLGDKSVHAAGSVTATSNNSVLRAATDRTGEYFLLENRQPLGYDRGLERWLGTDFGGLAIWHVDENQADNNAANHPLLDLEEADNSAIGSDPADLNGQPTDLWYAGGNDLFDNNSSPNSRRYDNGATEVSWVNISASSAVMGLYAGPANGAPSVVDDSAQTDEDTAVEVEVLGNDVDPDGDSLSVDGFDLNSGNGGTVQHLGNGLFRYTPPADFNGVDSFGYTAGDGFGGRATAQVSIDVSAINDAPRPADDSFSTLEDTPLDTSSLLLNDIEVEAETISIIGFDAATTGGGSIQHLGDGVFRYQPRPDFNGADSFSYSVTDPHGAQASATVNITVQAVNDAPVANPDNISIDEDQSIIVSPLDNDLDVDGDALSLESFDPIGSAGGRLERFSATAVRYIPQANFHGEERFNYRSSDGNGGTADGVIILNITEVNDAPQIFADLYSTKEDISLLMPDPSANDTDVDGDPLHLVRFDPRSQRGGILTTEGDGIRYQPAADYHGPDSFFYRVADDRGGETVGQVLLSVNAVNDTPVAQNDAVTLAEDNSALLRPLDNDSDVDGDELTIVLLQATSDAGGSLALQADGSVLYTPVAHFHGDDGFNYRISDPAGASAEARVSLTVTPVNDAPEIGADAHATDEDISLLLPDPSGNDSDVDGDPVSMAIFDARSAAGGTVSAEGAGLRYTPPANFHGEDSFGYTASDDLGGETRGLVRITVNSVNDAPVATDDSSSTNEDSSLAISVLANDSDVDGDSLSVLRFDAQSTAGGSVSLLPNQQLNYAPAADFHGEDSFTYTVSDGQGGEAVASVRITVNPINDLPVAGEDSLSTDEDTPVDSADLTLNDSDVDGDTLTVVAVDSLSANGASLSALPGNRVRYSPPLNFHGQDSFAYRLSDGAGGEVRGTATVTVNAVNDAPTAADDSVSTSEDTTVEFSVFGNDHDVDGDLLNLDSFDSTGLLGQLEQLGGDRFRYTPAADFHGDESFSYQISDPAGLIASARVNISVSAVNDAPVAGEDLVSTDEDAAVDIADVLTNDSDVDGDTLLIASFDGASQQGGQISALGTRGFTYRPAANFAGDDTFSYRITDGNGGEASGTVRISVREINDAPVAINDDASTDEDTPLSIDALANDSDVDSDPLLILLPESNSQQGGTLTLDGSLVVYTPAADFNGADSFRYLLRDGRGGEAQGWINLQVAAINDAPVVTGESFTIDEDNSLRIPNVVSNDSDVDGDRLRVLSHNPTLPGGGSLKALGNNQFDYQPAPDFHGEDSFEYTVTDDNGGETLGTVTITILPVNDAPQAADDHFTLNEDKPLDSPSVLGNDSDVDNEPLNISAFDAVSAAGASVSHLGGGQFRYTPLAHWSGEDSFNYTVADPQGVTASAVVRLTVVEVNDLPVAGPDSGETAEDTPLQLSGLLDNDSDADGDPLSISTFSARSGSGGSVEQLGEDSFRYTPAADFHGEDSFDYTVSDGRGGSTVAQVSIRVTPVNDAPKAADDSASGDEDQSIDVDVLANDSDVDGDSISLSAFDAAPAAGGSVSQIGDARLRYTPPADFHGDVDISYSISDASGASDSATLHITVRPVNDAPVAGDDSANGGEDQPITIDVLANDSDIDGDSLRVSTVDAASANGGSIEILADGQLRYTPAADYHGADSFAYTVSDGAEGEDTAQVTLSIASINDAPDAQADLVEVLEEGSVEIDVLANDTDVDGDSLAVTQFDTSSPAGGVIERVAGQRLKYSPPLGFSGSDGFAYSVADSNGAVVSSRVEVTVIPLIPAEAPVIDPAGRRHYKAFDVQISTATEGARLRYTTDGSTPTPSHGSDVASPFTLRVEQSQTLKVIAWAERMRESAVVSADFVVDPALDSDEDGIEDAWEVEHGFDPNDPADALLDADGDGLSNLDEFYRGTDPRRDSTPPLMIAPADLAVDANGYHTAVDIGETIAVDLVDGEITPTVSDRGPYRPGRHALLWRAEDAVGNAVETEQRLDVHPLAELSLSESVAEGGNGELRLELNGDAAEYPVRLQFVVGGSADSSDHDLRSGTLEIAEGRSASLDFRVLSDDLAEASDEQIEVSVTAIENAVTPARSLISSRIIERNLAPRVTLSLFQNGKQVAAAARDGGPVEIIADASDPNPGDELAFNWSGSDNSVIAASTQSLQGLTIDASALDVGLYQLDLRLLDNGQPRRAVAAGLWLEVIETGEKPDEDGDGVSDDDDPLASAHLLQIDDSDTPPLRYLATRTGLKLRRGEIAVRAGRHGAGIGIADLREHSGGAEVSDPGYAYLEYFDVVIEGLDQPGANVPLSLPLQQVPGSRAEVRLFHNGQWQAFTAEEASDIQSAVLIEGECPAIDGNEFLDEIDPAERCLRLLLRDGGVNDADGVSDGRIQLRFGLGRQPELDATSSGGSALSAWLLLVLGLLGGWRRLATRRR